MTSTTIKKTVFFAASREVVWSFLTEKDKLAQWFHAPERDLEEGQEYTLARKNEQGVFIPQIWGKVLTMDAPNKLVYTFIIDPFGDAETTVTWMLEDAASGTRLTLIHEGIAEATGPMAMSLLTALDNGWDKHFDDLRKATQ
ncbi:MAG: SRPBCC domain-containing protein [Gammaproteobacteria bacterium]|nr:SRPBCC domain-containing protein [Gammaproteobacteria bacterium]